MHPLKHPRNVIVVGAAFVVVSVVYYLGADLWGGYVHIDFAGVTMLAALGVAMSLMAYVLVAGSTRD